MKRICSVFLVLLFLLSLPLAAHAETAQSRTVIGANLEPQQIEDVYNMFGVRRGDVIELTMTNAEERKYLEGYVDESLIGTRSISCVYVELLPEGSGMSVTTSNITWCTGEMYMSALATAGITDARIIVAAPFEVSGTAALTGIYKAYEDMTGMKTKVVKGADSTSCTIGGLKKGKTYYFSIRVRKNVDGVNYYTTFGVPRKVTVTQ